MLEKQQDESLHPFHSKIATGGSCLFHAKLKFSDRRVRLVLRPGSAACGFGASAGRAIQAESRASRDVERTALQRRVSMIPDQRSARSSNVSANILVHRDHCCPCMQCPYVNHPKTDLDRTEQLAAYHASSGLTKVVLKVTLKVDLVANPNPPNRWKWHVLSTVKPRLQGQSASARLPTLHARSRPCWP